MSLHKNPDIVDFRMLQNMISNSSGRKNPKASMNKEPKILNSFSHGKEALVYPVSLKGRGLVIRINEGKTHLMKMDRLNNYNIIIEEINF